MNQRNGLILVWIGFSLALAFWQFSFTSSMIENHIVDDNLQYRLMRMIRWEAATLATSLILGATALIVLNKKENKAHKTLQVFFSTFTHEIKTSIAALKLKTEYIHDLAILKQDITPTALALINESNRLQHHLDNSLAITQLGQSQINHSEVLISNVISVVRLDEIQIHLSSEVKLIGDLRLFEIIFRNIIYNSIKHGQASNLYIKSDLIDKKGKLLLTINDDGIGYTGPMQSLGHLFYRPLKTSGNGMGLYLISRLLKLMNGSLIIPEQKPGAGFCLQIHIDGQLT